MQSYLSFVIVIVEFVIKLFFAEIEQLSGQDIERLGKTQNPSYTLFKELSSRKVYTIECLFKRLVTDMEYDSLAKEINDWIDLRCIAR